MTALGLRSVLEEIGEMTVTLSFTWERNLKYAYSVLGDRDRINGNNRRKFGSGMEEVLKTTNKHRP